jgi:predicted dehydrogenase
MTAKKLKFGLVGAGAIAQTYAQILRGDSCGRAAGVADIRKDAADAVAEVLGCPSYASAAELAANQSIDAVIICTPPSTHAGLCRLFLERSIHVLCEKPLTLEASEALELLKSAKKANKLMAMASKFRYVDDVVRAKSLLLSGMLGQAGAIRIAFRSQANMAKRWNSDREVSGGGVLIDNGPHAVDLIRYLLGPIKEVFAAEGERVQGLPVEETVQLVARTVNGTLATVDTSWSMSDASRDYVQISCAVGSIVIGWKESGYRRLPDGDWVRFGHGYSKLRAIQRQTENFARAVLGEETLLISQDDQLASVEVISAAYRSLASGKWERICQRPTETQKAL